MRDAFGGAFMIQIFLIFILIYICFTAMALNYAKAFKVKNVIIDYLESNEIESLDKINAAQLIAMDKFFQEEVLGKYNYNKSGQQLCTDLGVKEYNDAGERVAYCHQLGIIIKESGTAENTEGVYYTVSTYFGWNMPFLNNLLRLNGNNSEQGVPVGTWEISGQTRLIVNE